MRKVTRQEAIDLISTEKKLFVVVSSDNCVVCKKFIPDVLEVLEPEFPDVTMVEITRVPGDFNEDKNWSFGPDSFPMSFIFINGVRHEWIKGSAPLNNCREKFQLIFSKDEG